MSVIESKDFLNSFQREIDEDAAALFIGAGISRPAGYVDWKELMREVAEDLKLDVNKETDLIALAQYHHTSQKSRYKLNRLLITEFTKEVTLTENHRLIATLPISTIWTTNYDRLLEKAYEAAHKRWDAKWRPKHLATTKPHCAVTIYKMHGDIEAADEAVLTKQDYAAFEVNRGVFGTQLRGHLVSKSFLFLGYSFSDPNIDYVLMRVRALFGESSRIHYCLMRDVPEAKKKSEKADREYERRKLELRIEDLQTYGIHTVLIKEYAEVTEILAALNKRAVRRNVFVSGSAHDYGSLGQAGMEAFARALGQALIENNYNLMSGLGLGIGGAVTIGALESLYESPAGNQVEERMILRPFPQVQPAKGDLKDIWERYRQEMLARAGFAVFIAGNKLDPTTGEVVMDADGVRREFEVGLEHRVFPIPVGGTGSVAKQLSLEVLGDVKRFYGEHAKKVAPALRLLADSAEERNWTKAILDILKIVAPK